MRRARPLQPFGVLALLLLSLAGAAARTVQLHAATATIAAARWPYLPGSRLALRVAGITAPYAVTIFGPGRLLPGNTYEVPVAARTASALVIAGNTAGLGSTLVRIGSPPKANAALLLVASYDDGLVLHDSRSFAAQGVLATGGAPSDVAVDAAGRVAVTDTQGSELTLVGLAPWSVARIAGVVTADEIAIDRASGAIFATDRDWNGSGALTRVLNGSVARVATGDTAEGLAVDERRGLVYVANANDGTIAVVDARSLRVLRRFRAIERVFSLALSPNGRLLYAISNEAADSMFAHAGSAIAIDVGGVPRVVAHSAPLAFPIGVALDARSNTLFVSDESLHAVYVLDARTLRAKRPPLGTCAVPWKLTFDAPSERLYVPCAADDEVDVFDARTLQRAQGAPFATGGYPLAIAVRHP